MAGKVERVLNTALGGELGTVLNVTTAELLSEPEVVADAIQAALNRPGVGVTGHWMVHELLRRSALEDGLIDALASPDPLTRAGAARVCGAARIPDSELWIADLLEDEDPRVRQAAATALGALGGRRAVDALITGAIVIPLHRLTIALARAMSDLDVEGLLRQPANERVAVAIVLSCGLRCDVLRISPLMGIAHDRRWPQQVRLAACRALAAIGDRSAADGLHRLAEGDADPRVRAGASKAYVRLVRRAVARPR